MLPNITRGKGNKTMKFGQLIEYNKRNIFHQKSCRTKEIFSFKSHSKKETGRLVPDLFLLFKKALYKVKASGL